MNQFDDKRVCFIQSDTIVYPDWKDAFSPSELYPEYPFSDAVSNEQNHVYEAVRDFFHSLGMDNEHYGSPDWNPLGELIHPGDKVLVKPNWVMHYNHNQEGGMDCVVTHPSVVRAVLDYIYIATHGMGRIVVGDAPMAECDLEELYKTMHYDILWHFFKDHSYEIQVVDFRSNLFRKKQRVELQKPETGIIVDLGRSSSYEDLSDKQIRNFVQVKGTYSNNISNFHSRGIHKYLINKIVLDSDVIINLPKIKTHRKAGLTACMKNYVGTCQIKDCLPHSIYGGADKGGCEYPNSNLFATFDSKVKKYQFKHEAFNPIMGFLHVFFTGIAKRISPNNKLHWGGAWYGNDTIWRFVCDLNHVIVFADKEGSIKSVPQRKFLNLGDAIIAGQRNAPLSPSPKELHAIVGGYNGVAIDYFISQLMGFDSEKIKYISQMMKLNGIDDEDIVIVGEGKKLYSVSSFPYHEEWKFTPSDGWKGFIEKK